MNKAEIIGKCIDDIEAGICTLEQCLTKYPEIRDELRSLFYVTASIQNSRAVPSAEFKRRARIHLVEAMRLDSIHVGKRSRPFNGFGALNNVKRAAMIACCGFFVMIIAGSSTAYASRDSIPSDTLYPVKRGLEKVQIALTPGSENKANLHLELSARRVQEALQQSNLKKNIDSAALESLAINIDAAVKEISKYPPDKIQAFVDKLAQVTLDEELILNQLLGDEDIEEHDKVTIAKSRDMAFRGNLIAKVAYNNPDFLYNHPTANDTNLEKSHFKVEGTLSSAENGTWKIGGLSISGIKQSQAVPPIGSTVEIEGLSYSGAVQIISIEYKQASTARAQIEGIYSGNANDNTIWYISGISVDNIEKIAPPLEDQGLKLDGLLQNGNFVIDDLNDEDKRDIEISGTLRNFNSTGNSIVVIHEGQQIIINISQALIKTEDGQTYNLSNFVFSAQRQVHVGIEGLYQKNNVLYAKLITLEFDEIYLEKDKPKTNTGEDTQVTEENNSREKAREDPDLDNYHSEGDDAKQYIGEESETDKASD